MKALHWIHTDPRGKLVVAILFYWGLVIFAYWLELGYGPWYVARDLMLYYVWPVLLPLTGWVLRQRHRTLLWLLLFLPGLGVVPMGIALFGRPGQQV